MKNTLLASTALVLSVGAAAAADFTMADTGHDHSITLSGDARMGVTNDKWPYDLNFTSRARVEFTGSGETDGGLGFGFSFRADNAGGAADGTAGSVHISQGGHKLAMGDVDSASEAAVGNVSGVGLTGLGDRNDTLHFLPDDTPSALYSYTGGALSFNVGIDGNGGGSDGLGEAYSLGAKFDGGSWHVAAGYENYESNSDKWFLGGGVELGSVMFKVVHGDWKGFGIHETDTAASIDLTAGATTFTAFVNHFDSDLGGADHYGLGVSHDLGGGASLVAGVVDSRYEGEVIWDAGISMDF